MENGLVLNDFKQFLVYKRKIILIFTLLITLAIIGFSVFKELRTNDEVEETAEPVEEIGDFTDSDIEELLLEDRENLSNNDISMINDFLYEDAYAFRMYIENRDGSVFNRSNLMHEIFTSDQVINMLESQAGHELDLIEDFFVTVDYNSNNVIFTITIGTGNAEANAAISQALYDSLAENEIEIINEKVTYLFEEPQSVDLNEDIQEVEVADSPSDNLLETVGISAIIGIFLGAGFGVVAAYAHSLIEKKVNPLYNFNLKSGDIFINFSDKKKSEDLIQNEIWHAIMHPVDKQKLVLTQSGTLRNQLAHLADEESLFSGDIASEAHDVKSSKEFDEIIVIVENGNTDKQWYTDQVNQIKVYGTPTKIIKL